MAFANSSISDIIATTIQSRSGELADNVVPVRGHAAQDVLPAGVLQAGFGQVAGVEGFIHHGAVRPVLPAAHQGRGDVARTRPHADADGH